MDSATTNEQMNGMAHVFRRMRAAAAAGAAGALLAGCVSVPDARQMREIRAEAAGRRVENLARPETTESGVYLSGPLLLWEAVALARGYNRSLEQEREGREIARGRIQASWSEALPSLDLTGYVRLEERPPRCRTVRRTPRGMRPDQRRAAATQPLFNGGSGPRCGRPGCMTVDEEATIRRRRRLSSATPSAPTTGRCSAGTCWK